MIGKIHFRIIILIIILLLSFFFLIRNYFIIVINLNLIFGPTQIYYIILFVLLLLLSWTLTRNYLPSLFSFFFVVVGDTHKQNRDSPNCKFTCHYINNGRGKIDIHFFHYILLLLLN